MPSPKERKHDQPSAEDQEFTQLLHEREQDPDLERQLETMYATEAATDASIARAERNPWKRISRLFVVLLVLLASISWAGFFLLHERRLNQSDQVALEIAGPTEVRAGEEIVYEVRYRNTGEFPLSDAVLELTLPPQLYLVDAVPAYATTGPPAGRTLRWQLAPVAGDYSGKVEVKAVAIGMLDEAVPLRAHLRYRPENFSSSFSEEAVFAANVTDTGLHAAVEAPAFVNVNDPVTVNLTYALTQASALSEAFVWLEYGEYFKPGESETLPRALPAVAQTPQELKLTGTFTAMPRADEAVIVHVGIPAPQGAEQAHVSIYRYEWRPTVISGALQLSVTVNGSAAGRPVNFGDTLRYVLHYKNSSETALENVALLAAIDSSLVDWSTLQDERGGEVRDDALLWTTKEIAGLERLAPGAEGSVSFSIAIKGMAAAANAETAAAAVTLSADYSIGGTPAERDVPAARIRVPVNSDFAFKTSLRYFGPDGASVGSGPWPPRAGERSVVQAQWILTNSLHDLSNIEVVAMLPAGVEWADDKQVNIGAISYDAGSRTVRWAIGSWGAEAEPAVASFDIAFTPTVAQRGNVVTLIGEARAEAKDATTTGVIVRTVPAATSALPDDASAAGGIVQ